MSRKSIAVPSVVACTFLFALPVSALTPLNIPGCGGTNNDGTSNFVLVSRDNIILEGGTPSGSTIGSNTADGNLLVTNPSLTNPGSPTGTGFVKLGPNVTVNGTVTANTIILPSNGTAKVTKCVANMIVGPLSSCLNNPPANSNAFGTFAAAHSTCVSLANFPNLCIEPGELAPAVNPCANAAPSLAVDGGNTMDLSGSGCFGDLVLGKGARLNLAAPGPFTFKSIRMKSGSQLNGVPANSAPAEVRVNADFITENGAFMTDVLLNSAQSLGSLAVFNNDILVRVVINGPFGRVHLHTGAQLNGCSGACGKFIDVEPITTECTGAPEVFCACREGLVLNIDPNSTNPVNQAARLCVPAGQ